MVSEPKISPSIPSVYKSLSSYLLGTRTASLYVTTRSQVVVPTREKVPPKPEPGVPETRSPSLSNKLLSKIVLPAMPSKTRLVIDAPDDVSVHKSEKVFPDICRDQPLPCTPNSSPGFVDGRDPQIFFSGSPEEKYAVTTIPCIMLAMVLNAVTSSTSLTVPVTKFVVTLPARTVCATPKLAKIASPATSSFFIFPPSCSCVLPVAPVPKRVLAGGS